MYHNATNLIKLLSCWQRPRFPLQYYNGKLKLTANVANVTVELIKTWFAADLSLAKTLRLSLQVTNLKLWRNLNIKLILPLMFEISRTTTNKTGERACKKIKEPLKIPRGRFFGHSKCTCPNFYVDQWSSCPNETPIASRQLSGDWSRLGGNAREKPARIQRYQWFP